MKIYALKCEQLVLYVGKTNETLERRAWRHSSKWNEAYSKFIPEWMGWEIVLLEEVPDEQGTAKEQHYYDVLKPLYNHNRPGQTAQERAQSVAGKERTSSKNKRARNAPGYKEWKKQYRDTDEYRAKRAEGMRRLRAKKAILSQ